MATALSVNVNAIALLRNRRNLPWPSVEAIARIALEAGAHGITVHPRPDERHIRRLDVPVLASLVRQFPGAEFNIEGNPDARFIELVESVRPDQVTLVPDDVRQATSDHGFDIAAHRSFLSGVIARLRIPSPITKFECSQHGGNHGRTRWQQASALASGDGK